ncbi:hypothetical protein GLOTRDRAFT_137955 [Gloeophyllum trabeum ATCC 11539]|uniref:Phenol 2-monooxygenase n=1 Tax=Gloeophyllum trabeum (strain ATCC 11539 / FP-39264 / Madison 617) TaxID=670483 RepID=S7RST4_GLOTA|nr:uncharacterized protein GLOTRDRAFT_137955 [Gloeophyllum trabeum ATCC 11539]EPQ56124.1 hypothetical protein GLOTRDRAFT_137955 [Gloeophyllum trabeum ATCC 11539]
MPAPLVKESTVDVLVIGAGPAGLMAANALGRAGVNVRIIDKRPKKVAAGQADGIQPRIIEVFHSYGLGERLLREGCRLHMAAFYNPGPDGGIELTSRARNISAATARFPFALTLNQGAIESIFLDSMRAMDLQVDRPIVPSYLEISSDEAELQNPQSHAVKVVLQHLDAEQIVEETEIVKAKYLIGADGAHSWVRKQFPITMDGEHTDYVWGVVDLIPDTDFPDIRNRCAIHSNNGSCMIVPREGDLVRLYLQLTDDNLKRVTNPNTGKPDISYCNPQQLLEVAKKTFYPYRIDADGEVGWWTLYIIGQRVASQFSINDRVFIAGDACHTHSPKAGQGMNASMNDTHNLAWKLSHVLRGWAHPSLLKTYEFERRRYAQDLINFDKTFARLFSNKPRTKDNQNGVTHEEFVDVFSKAGGFTSGIGIHYNESPIVNPTYQSLVANVVVGERMPPQTIIRVADSWPFELQDLLPADTRFKVVFFTGDYMNPTQRDKVLELAEKLNQPESFLRKFTPKGARSGDVFDLLTIAASKKEQVTYTDFPKVFRPHWSKIYTDDVDFSGKVGGKVYSSFGVGPSGAIVVVRPDQYVGMISPLDKFSALDDYFSSFMTRPAPL